MQEISYVAGRDFKDIRRLGGEFFWIILGQAVAALGGVIGVRMLSHVLNPNNYGQLSLGMTAAVFTQQVIWGPLIMGAARFCAPATESNQLSSYLRGIKQLVVQSFIVLISLTGISALGLIVFLQGKWLALLLIASAFSALSSSNSLLDGIQNASRQRMVVAFHQGLAQWLRFSLAIALVAIVGESSSAAMGGYALASTLVLSSQLLFLRRGIPTLICAELATHEGDPQVWAKTMLNYGWPFATWGFFTCVHIISDRWALQLFGSTSEVGLYTVLYQLGYYPVNLLYGLMVQLVYPILYQRAGNGADSNRMKKVFLLNNSLTLASLGLAFSGTVVAFFIHEWVFGLLVPLEYQHVSWLLPWMVLSAGLFGGGQFAVLSLLRGTETRTMITPKISTALLGIFLNLIGAKWLGLAGVVWAGLTFSFAYFTWMFCLALNSAKKPLH